jgi:hypothetical protein
MTKTRDAELADPTFTDRTIADSSASERVQTERRAVLDRVRALARARRLDGPPAARSQDFLYGGDGLPQ